MARHETVENMPSSTSEPRRSAGALARAALLCLSFAVETNASARDWDNTEPPKNGADYYSLGKQIARCGAYFRLEAEEISSGGGVVTPTVQLAHERSIRAGKMSLGFGLIWDNKMSADAASEAAEIVRKATEDAQHSKLKLLDERSRVAEFAADCLPVKGWVSFFVDKGWRSSR